MTSLDPLYTIGSQIVEPIMQHRGLCAARGRAQEAIELLKLVQIPQPERRMKSYPHELSGGQRQRVMIAMALANDPDILIADEPTTALDVTIQAQILALLAELQARLGMAIIFITHDLGIVRRFADRVYVMRSGVVVEDGDDRDDLRRAEASLYAACCSPPSRPAARRRRRRARRSLLDGRNVAVMFQHRRRLSRRPADRASRPSTASRSTLREGQTIGIVGESGSGKSTLGRALLRLLPSEGAIRFEGSDISKRRPRADDAAAARAAGRVPGPVRLAVAAHDRRPDRHRGPARARAVAVAQGARPPRRRGAQGGRARSRHAQPLPARILRRPAPAHRDRARHDPEAEGRRARRADLGARPLGAEADRRAAARRCSARTTSPTSSSATTSPWCARWPTTSSS